MADFTVNMTSSVELNDSTISLEAVQDFILAYGQENIVDSLVEYDRQIAAKSISFPTFALTAPATTPLSEKQDVDSTALSDGTVIFTPAEYGMAVTTTELIQIQSGGQALRATAQLVAKNMAQTTNILGTNALAATTNIVLPGSVTDPATLTAGDVMTASVLNRVYNKLKRGHVPFHSMGGYIALMHDDVIHDLRESATAGSWTDVAKYSDPSLVLTNEVGYYKGFRIISNSIDDLIGVDAGAAAVDNYTSVFLGWNGFGKAESRVPEMRITGPFDKLGRFVNVGWYGVFKYGIVQNAAVWKTITASSVGAN
jgi:N4-gp56 family major capsid protein